MKGKRQFLIGSYGLCIALGGLKKNGAVILFSEIADRNVFNEILLGLNGLKVIDLFSEGLCADLIMKIEDNYVLRTFTFHDESHLCAHSWQIFDNKNFAITVGPGQNLDYSSIFEP